MAREGVCRRRFLSKTCWTIAVGTVVSGTSGSVPAFSQVTTTNEQTYGGSEDDNFQSVIQTSDEGFLFAGTKASGASGEREGWAVKIGGDQDIQWERTYERGNSDVFQSVTQTTAGGYLFAGYTTSAEGEETNGWLIKTTSDGSIQWDRLYGGSENDSFSSVTETTDGEFLVAGQRASNSSGLADGWLLKTNRDGDTLWERDYASESNHSNSLDSVIETDAGQYLAVGAQAANLNGEGLFIKVASDGTTRWRQTHNAGGDSDVRLESVVETTDGGYLAAGSGRANGDGSNDGWLLKTERDGTLQWEQAYGPSDDAFSSVTESSSGGYLIVGVREEEENNFNAWALKTDADGNVEWEQTYGGAGDDYFRSVIETGEESYLTVGGTWSGENSNDGWSLRLERGQASRAATETETTEPAESGDSGSTVVIPTILSLLGLGGAGAWWLTRRGGEEDDSGSSAGTTISEDASSTEPPSTSASGPSSDESNSSGPSTDTTGKTSRSSNSGTASSTDKTHIEPRRVPDEIPRMPDVSVEYDALTNKEPIGGGGNADVSKATLPTSSGNVTLAIKRPRMSGTLHTDQMERMLQEAETWEKLDDNDHIVGVVDYGSEPIPWIAMEYMDAGHLGVRNGELGIPQALWTAIAITKGVRHAHRRGVAHLDLKPENVLFRSVEDAWDVPKVADWGLSKHLLEHSKSVEGLSPQYAAPEQFDEDFGSADDITDIYQLGAVFYELFTGQPPFEGKPAKAMHKVLHEQPTPPSEISAVPDKLDEILLTALAKEKFNRYDNVAYLRDALQDVYDES